MMSSSSTATDTDQIDPIHPGEVIMEDFIEEFGITQNKLATTIGVPPRRINEIVHGKRGITADTAVRLAKYFGTSAEFWMNLQSHYELKLEHRTLREQLDSIVPLQSGAQTLQTAYVTEARTRRRVPATAGAARRTEHTTSRPFGSEH